jgi:GTP-binding protein LepA
VLNKIDLPAADPEKYAAELANLIGGDPRRAAGLGQDRHGVEELLDRIVEIPRRSATPTPRRAR